MFYSSMNGDGRLDILVQEVNRTPAFYTFE